MNNKRVSDLFSIGLIFNGEEFIHKVYKDINVHWTEVTCDTEKDFNKKFSKIEKEIERRNNLKQEVR